MYGTGLYRLGRGGRDAWRACRPATLLNGPGPGCLPQSSVPEPAAKPRPLPDPHPESPPPDCRKQRPDAVGSSPLGHPHGHLSGPSPPRARGPLPNLSLSMLCTEVFECQTKPAPSKPRPSRLRAASSAWPGAVKAHKSVARMAQEHSEEITGCTRRIEVLEACLQRAQSKP